MSEKEELKYYDVLYDFANVVMHLNEQAIDGIPKKSIEKSVIRLIPAFTTLCGMDMDAVAKKETPKKAKQEPTPEQPKEEPEPLPSNFMKEDNGWGLCPICRKKVLKLTKSTKLIDFPAYCKSCKMEHIVSWWNVENKDIEYTRYVNDNHYKKQKNIHDNAMKGTGVQVFMRTRTSATERVAMHL